MFLRQGLLAQAGLHDGLPTSVNSLKLSMSGIMSGLGGGCLESSSSSRVGKRDCFHFSQLKACTESFLLPERAIFPNFKQKHKHPISLGLPAFGLELVSIALLVRSVLDLQ